MLAQNVRGERPARAIDRLPEEVVGALARAAPRERAVCQRLLERRPAVQAVLERERVLHFAQCDLGAGVRQHAAQALARRGVAFAQRFRPALRFFLQGFESCGRTERTGARASRHTTTFRYRLESAECRPERGLLQALSERVGGKIPLPRTGGAPKRAGISLEDRGAPCQSVWS